MTESRIAPEFFTPEPGSSRLAYLFRAGNNLDPRGGRAPRDGPAPRLPGLFWLSGYRADMRGAKATFLDALAAEQNRACLRFDYSGHGESEGAFTDGVVGRWADEACAIFRALTRGPQIVVGSSMGGWIALLLARALTRLGERHRLAGMILIAPATDFSEELVWPRLPEAVREVLTRDGVWQDDQNVFTREFFEDGRRNAVFGSEIRTFCPVHILQGMADEAVPWRHALKLLEHLAADPAIMCLIRDGDHSLSRPQDLKVLSGALAQIDGGLPT